MDERELDRLISEVEAAEPAPTPPDTEWDRLAAGRLSDDEVARLEAAAAGGEGAAELEAFRPFDAGFRTRLVRTLDAMSATTAARPAPEPTTRPRWRWLLLAIPAFAALLMAVWPQPPDLPGYSLEATVADAVLRGDDARSAPLSPGSTVEIVLRADVAHSEPIGARVFTGTPPDALAFVADLAPTGNVRLVGTLGTDFELPPGPHRLIVDVGPSHALETPSHPESQVFQLDIEVRESPSP